MDVLGNSHLLLDLSNTEASSHDGISSGSCPLASAHRRAGCGTAAAEYRYARFTRILPRKRLCLRSHTHHNLK